MILAGLAPYTRDILWDSPQDWDTSFGVCLLHSCALQSEPSLCSLLNADASLSASTSGQDLAPVQITELVMERKHIRRLQVRAMFNFEAARCVQVSLLQVHRWYALAGNA